MSDSASSPAARQAAVTIIQQRSCDSGSGTSSGMSDIASVRESGSNGNTAAAVLAEAAAAVI